MLRVGGRTEKGISVEGFEKGAGLDIVGS